MKLNLFAKLMISFMTLIVLPLTIVSLVAYSIAARIIHDNISRSYLQNVRQYSANVEMILGDAERAVYTMTFDTFEEPNPIKTNLEKYQTADKYQQSQIKRKIVKDLNQNTIYRNSINGIYILDFAGNVFSSGNALLDSPKFSSFSWYLNFLADSSADAVWSPSHKISSYTNTSNANVVTFLKKIKNRYGEEIGVIWLDLNERYLENVYTTGELAVDNRVYIIGPVYHVISSSDKTMVASRLDADNERLFSRTFDEDNGYYFKTDQGTEKFVAHSRVHNTDWQTVMEVPVKSIFVSSDRIKNIIGILTIVFALLSIIAVYFFSRRVTKPIQALIGLMEKASEGNLSVRAQEDSSDEFGKLNTNFNVMISEIENLISTVYMSNLKQKEAELASLEAQINPHFLYNTLQSIKWMSDMYKAHDIGDMAISLAKIFRFSIKGAPIVTLYEEIQHVNDYVNIQKYRYGERLVVEYQIDGQLMNCRIPKLIIQPLVENALYHGIDMKEGPGHIVISAKEADGVLTIGVADNGVGISGSKYQEINANLYGKEPQNKGKKGLGLKNIHERLQLLYGNGYGLMLMRAANGGVVAELNLPAQREAISGGGALQEELPADRVNGR